MTIKLTQSVRHGGSVLAAGTTQTLETSIEADLVARNCATWLSNPADVLSDKPVTAKTNPLTGGIAKLTAAGRDAVADLSLSKLNAALSQPWKIATFGDSRASTSSSGADIGQYQTISDLRTAGFIAAAMGDAEIVRNYGISGDLASNWNNATRTDTGNSKTFYDMIASDVDAVYVQYGINDAQALTPAATTIPILQALCLEIMKAGKYVLYESTHPVCAPLANYAQVQAIADQCNAAMQAWAAFFPKQMVFANSAAQLKDATGYANPAYMDSAGLHFILPGAMLSGEIVAAAARDLMPERQGAFLGANPRFPNLLNLASPTPFFNVESGAATNGGVTSGYDARGYYTEFLFTPTSLTSGQCRVRCELSVNFLTSAPPYYTLTGNEILQGAAWVEVDDGNGGAPAAYAVAMRQRYFTGSVFRDWGIIPAGTPATTGADFTKKFAKRLVTPRVANAAASVSAAPATSSGYQLHVFVSTSTTGTPVRLRIYNAQLRIVGFNPLPKSITAPASGSAYTNTSVSNQQVIVSGGTVSALALNGVSLGLTAGVFVLLPGDTLTPTYTVAPTMLVTQI